MSFSNEQLLDGLNSVTTIPLIPFRGGIIDYDAHARNITYLMENNHLSDGRPRVICVAGTSLIHHVSYEEQNKLIEVTGEVMKDQGILLSAIVPNPLPEAERLIELQSRMKRSPDAYLIMPLGGVYSMEGFLETFHSFGEKMMGNFNARLLYYHRQSRDLETVVRLVRESSAFIGIKVGTQENEVTGLCESIGNQGMVIWGVGDRSTEAARLGARGHTSGISVLFARAGDLINNAQRVGDFETSQEIENRISAFEKIRFENGRVYNYSAVVEAMIESEFDDIDSGDGGPFNPRVPDDVAKRVKDSITAILDLH
jgi:dihydrodipicolinate synthase/N-acetylneuraminate lyase